MLAYRVEILYTLAIDGVRCEETITCNILAYAPACL